VGGDDETSHLLSEFEFASLLERCNRIFIILPIDVDGFSKVAQGFKSHTISIALIMMLERVVMMMMIARTALLLKSCNFPISFRPNGSYTQALPVKIPISI
jgi:hypothetical protein